MTPHTPGFSLEALLGFAKKSMYKNLSFLVAKTAGKITAIILLSFYLLTLTFPKGGVLGNKLPEATRTEKANMGMANYSRVTDIKSTLKVKEEQKQKEKESRVLILESYLKKYNSPMASNSRDFIEAADSNSIDWKLVPAITGVESGFGKNVPYNSYTGEISYNGWGWGVYGSQAIYFKSWKEGIYTVTTGLRENYINKGLTDPYSINSVYAESPSWGSHVSYFMADLDQFAKSYSLPADLKPQAGEVNQDLQVVGTLTSTDNQLALKQ